MPRSKSHVVCVVVVQFEYGLIAWGAAGTNYNETAADYPKQIH